MKFCPECGTRLDGKGYCGNCRKTYGTDSFVTNDSEYAEFLIFQNFEYEKLSGGGYKLIKARNKEIKKVIVPASIKEIGEGCFMDCKELVDVEFLGELESIPDYAFAGTSVVLFSWPEGLKTIGQYAFANADFGIGIELPEGLEAIGNFAFENATMCSVTLPSTLKLVGANAFSGVKDLGDVFIRDLKSYLNVDFVNALANPNYIAQSLALEDDDSLLDEMIVPEGVGELRPFAFAGSMAEKLYIPRSVFRISPLAFINCDNLEEIKVHPENYDFAVTADGLTTKNGENLILALRDEISKKIKAVGPAAFCACSYRIEVRIENPNASVSEGALYNCQELEFYTGPLAKFANGVCNTVADLFRITLNTSNWFSRLEFTDGKVPRTLSFLEFTSGTVLGTDTFDGVTELVSLVLPPNLAEIRRNVFCNLCAPEITIPATVTKIENLTRRDRSMIGTIKCAPGGSYKIVDGALLTADGKTMVASIRGTKIPSTVVKIMPEAFAYNEELKTVKLDGNIRTVERNAFMGCPNLTSAYIGPWVMSFSAEMFAGCDSLKSVTVEQTKYWLEGEKPNSWNKETVFLSTPEINARKIFNPLNAAYGMITRRRID